MTLLRLNRSEVDIGDGCERCGAQMLPLPEEVPVFFLHVRVDKPTDELLCEGCLNGATCERLRGELRRLAGQRRCLIDSGEYNGHM